MRSCDTMAVCPVPCMFYRSFKMFKISTFDYLTMSGIDDFFFFATVTEGVVHIVYKLVTGSPFGVTWQYKVSGGIGS